MQDLAQFVALARRSPGGQRIGTVGNGSAGHVSLVVLGRAAGIEITHVPYRGSSVPAVTDEFLPGFKNSAASYTVSLLNPKVIRDLELERHGLKVVLRKTDNFLPGDGEYLLAGRNGARLGSERSKAASHFGVARLEQPRGNQGFVVGQRHGPMNATEARRLSMARCACRGTVAERR